MNGGKSVIVSAPAKVILFGEHSILYGSKALACAIGLRTVVAVSKDSPSNYILVEHSNGDFHIPLDPSSSEAYNITIDNSDMQQTCRVILLLVKDILPPKSMNVKITISSQIPIRAGLGSSAALSAALAGALYYYAHGRLDLDLIQHFAHNAERVFHSNPSGLDSFSSIFASDGQFEGLPFTDYDFEILILNTNIQRNTRQLVEGLRHTINVDQEATDGMNRLSRVVINGIESVLNGSSEDAQTLLSKLGVSLPEIDRLCSHLEERFGLSFKISGAGGGGCIISFPIRKSTSVNIEEIVSEAQKIIPNVTGYVTKPINVGLRMEE